MLYSRLQTAMDEFYKKSAELSMKPRLAAEIEALIKSDDLFHGLGFLSDLKTAVKQLEDLYQKEQKFGGNKELLMRRAAIQKALALYRIGDKNTGEIMSSCIELEGSYYFPAKQNRISPLQAFIESAKEVLIQTQELKEKLQAELGRHEVLVETKEGSTLEFKKEEVVPPITKGQLAKALEGVLPEVNNQFEVRKNELQRQILDLNGDLAAHYNDLNQMAAREDISDAGFAAIKMLYKSVTLQLDDSQAKLNSELNLEKINAISENLKLLEPFFRFDQFAQTMLLILDRMDDEQWDNDEKADKSAPVPAKLATQLRGMIKVIENAYIQLKPDEHKLMQQLSEGVFQKSIEELTSKINEKLQQMPQTVMNNQSTFFKVSANPIVTSIREAMEQAQADSKTVTFSTTSSPYRKQSF